MSSVLAYNSKSLLATSDSFPLIMSHIWFAAVLYYTAKTAANHIILILIYFRLINMIEMLCFVCFCLNRTFLQNNYRHIMTDSPYVIIGKSSNLFFTNSLAVMVSKQVPANTTQSLHVQAVMHYAQHAFITRAVARHAVTPTHCAYTIE